MNLEADPTLMHDDGGSSAFKPLLWIVVAALAAVITLMFAPVPPI
jgi:hypothetical protein